jgi:glycosyltransferase involved in cell wall biosynthesis
MKILFINQFYWPDSSATSQQLTDLTTGLAARGHEISVLCGEGGYAAAAGSQPPAGVEIIRVKTLKYVRGKVGRVASYASFYLAALFRGIFAPRFDVVVTLTTPPLISLTGALIKMLRGSRHFIYEQDMYPDVAVDLNTFTRGGVVERVVGMLADPPRRHADGVIALGPCMKSRLVARGIPAEQILVAENWANGAAIEPMPRPGDPKQLVLLYSGNLGLAHDLDTLTGAMTALKDDPRFHFVFVGSGGRRKELEEICAANGLRSVEMRGYVPRDQLSYGLSLGDIGLVTQHNVCCGSVVPSKLYGILAAGRPVLFIGPKEATPALTIARHDCGWQVEPGDVEGLCRLLRTLADHPEVVQEAGVRARQALVEHYDLQPSIDRIEAILTKPHDPAVNSTSVGPVPHNSAATNA